MKKVLIISYYWPPSGGSGVQRWVKLSKYLSKQDVECHVLTVDENQASFPNIDKSLIKDILPQIKVYKTDSFEPIQLYSKLVGKENVPSSGFTNVDNTKWKQKVVNGLRSNLFIPDPRKGWNKYAFKEAKRIIKKENIQTVITTSPPHSTQLVGRKLKRKLDIHWIADLRDPWTDIYYYPILNHSKWSHKINKKLELSVIEESDQLITVGQGCRDIFKSKSKNISEDKIKIIENGYDPEDFEGLKKTTSDEKFRIVYTGLMSDMYYPEVFFKAISLLNNRDKITIQIIGDVSDSILDIAKKLNVNVDFIPHVSHAEILQYQINADALLLVIPKIADDKAIITGKIFEYLASSNPIIGIGPVDGDASNILTKSNSGKMFDRDQVEDIKNFVHDLINNTFRVDSNFSTQYSREEQAKKVAQLIK